MMLMKNASTVLPVIDKSFCDSPFCAGCFFLFCFRNKKKAIVSFFVNKAFFLHEKTEE